MATEGGETESPPVEATDIGSYMFLQKIVAQVENGTALTIVTEPEQEENAAWVSKIYNSLLLTLLFSLMALAGPGQYFYNEEAAFSGSFTVTDMGVALGAWLAVWSCGGVYSYFKSARIQLQMNDHLAREVETSGFEQHWMMQKGKDSLSIFLLWLVTFGSRMALALRTDLDPFGELKLALYALASACILSACYTQISMWRGISLAIVAYARSVLEGEMNCREARGKWREVISCMRQTSRMYQLTAASCGLTTVLVCFGALYDLSNRSGLAILDALPSLVIGLSLVGALYVAASATAHCTRLPSLVSMLDGDEELEHEYINLALFLSLSESGFFMWDTRVNLAVLQKFLYFTMAIVGTIGFQLKVFHFNAT
ncbi:Leucine-rich repeat and guanylate kinase domain-containing protein [Durusdinium trenchii]|uniref:Leucine-rich repeat and guanylate kinase domain-containing protein n=1 Tax=Durusdinium trenchii TaxID=1381693 RepID=A0ABP0ICY7_9DINO